MGANRAMGTMGSVGALAIYCYVVASTVVWKWSKQHRHGNPVVASTGGKGHQVVAALRRLPTRGKNEWVLEQPSTSLATKTC